MARSILKTRRSRWFILSLIAVLLAGNVTAAQSVCKRKLSTRFRDNRPPFYYKDANGILTGFRVELLSAIMKKMDCPLVIEINIPWKRTLNMLKNGSLDLLTNASKTPEREQYALFSDSYKSEYVALYVRKGTSNRYNINTLNDIMGLKFRLGILRGNYYGATFAQLIKTPQFKKYVSAITLHKQFQGMLILERIDGFLDYFPNADIMIKTQGYTDKTERHPMPLIETGKIYVMFSKKSISPEIVHAFNKSLAKIKTDGTFNALKRKYFEPYGIDF